SSCSAGSRRSARRPLQWSGHRNGAVTALELPGPAPGVSIRCGVVSRTVTLVLVDGAGKLLGALPPVEVELPWWQSASDVVAAARDRFGLDVTVLRLLRAERPAP